MEGALELGLILGICLLIAGLARWKNIFDASGIAAAFTVGFVIGWFGDVTWLLVLLIFLSTGFVATKYKFKVKQEMGVQEGRGGERGWANVLATGLVPAAVALLSVFDLGPLYSKQMAGLLFITAVGVAASDTLASELGMLSKKAYLITTGKRVRAGTDGGISAVGQLWAFIASAYVAALGWGVLTTFSDTLPDEPVWVLIPAIMGFAGCQLDSLMGATVEGKWFVGKHSVNLLSIAIATILAWVVMAWL